MFKKIVIAVLSLFLLLGSVKQLTNVFDSGNKEFSENLDNSKQSDNSMEDEMLAGNFSTTSLYPVRYLPECIYNISATKNLITIPTPPPSKIS